MMTITTINLGKKCPMLLAINILDALILIKLIKLMKDESYD